MVSAYILYDMINLDGYTYLPAKGRYRLWDDFDSTVHGLFTGSLWDSLNNLRKNKKTRFIELDKPEMGY